MVFAENKLDKTIPYLKVHFFPVGEGDATIMECNDMKGNVSLTLVNAGTISSKKDEIEVEYFKFLESRLNKTNYFIKNIILTNADDRYYNFIRSLVFVQENELKKIRFYVADKRTNYNVLSSIFKKFDNVNEFTRTNEPRHEVTSCGHVSNDEEDTFFNCVKRGKNGPILNSNAVIELCHDFQINVLAANYGLSKKSDTVSHRKAKNSLLLKVTPTGKATPSILLGDFEDDMDANQDYYYSLIKDAHHSYTTSPSFPLSLSKGLSSTVLKIPQNGALTDSTLEDDFYTEFVQPTFAVISSGIGDAFGHPNCGVLKAADHYLSMISPKNKDYQCDPFKTQFSEGVDIARRTGSNNLYQTTTEDPEVYPNGRIQHNLITFRMTSNELGRPATQVLFKFDL